MLHFAVVYIYREWSLSVLYSSICIMSRCDKRQLLHDTLYVKYALDVKRAFRWKALHLLMYSDYIIDEVDIFLVTT